MPFKQLGLSEEILRSIQKHGFTAPTPIQDLAIPQIFDGTDLLVEAQTGSGKTACFAWPILQQLAAQKSGGKKVIQALILTPTRELALQVSAALSQFGEFLCKKVSALTVIGGESIAQQTQTLAAGVDIVVATPGRLLDLIGQQILSLAHLKFFVLDEADKILDLGFAAELELILEKIPDTRQNLFFSATYPSKVLEIAKRISKNPVPLKIDDMAPTVDTISQRVILVNKEKRGMLLRHLIKAECWRDGLVFVSSKIAAHNLCGKLRKAGINADALHGDLSQPERNKALANFKTKKTHFLVATDVAARGIDIEKLSLVINYDLPRSPADYIHRIGRTGRAGETGLAISFIGLEDQEHFKLIEKRAKIRLDREEIAGFELLGDIPEKVRGLPPIKGKRKSKKDRARELKRT
ncbi:MAG: DEAD/DEAH box helicase [Bdellovibrionales bacterium GWA2_49_15]|nr:MAG: DEAD/DEAH box helicase [Bdellovibrionales bacterium GWA2_49_15]HAZ14129.1 ATP-dependent helicase [Bdellovibrionales bacterium]